MSERRSSVVVGDKPEALLGALALPERDWEAMALAVEARLPGTAPGSSDAALLAAPLPAEAGEPESASVTPLANSGVRTQSLAELARQSLLQGGESDASIAKASLAVAARGRAQTEELAEKLRQSQVADAADGAPVDVTDSVQAEDDAPMPALAQARPGVSGNQLGYWVGAGGALLALAAAVALWLRPAPAPLIVTQVVEQKADKAPAPAAATPADEPKAVDPAALARENAAPPAVAASAPAAMAVTNTHAPSAGNAASAAASTAPAPDKIVLEDDTPNAAPVAKADPAQAGDKPATSAVAAAGGEPQMRPADNTAAGSLPAKPSMGAVQSAMAGVMSAARHCVAGESEPSSALVVFGSDGHVSSVSVSGGAAGKPAAACIQAALSRAKTQPFAESSFSFSFTVRP